MTGPVLLVGGGSGLATSGLLYLATYLRRNGVEAYARPLDTAPNVMELERRLHALLARTRPAVVGISLKWFLHIHRALHIASVVKRHDPNIRVVLGGDTASHYYRELLEFDAVDYVVRGDGEAPLLAIARGEAHPNAWHRGRSSGPLVGLGGLYAQSRDADDSGLSDLDAIFLCESDRYFVPPFVVGGKGCSQACLYCGGARGAQATNFGRRKSFMRPIENVRRDILALLPRAYTLVYDFSDHPLHDPVAELRDLWSGLDLSKSGILYYAWRVPPLAFVELLASTYESVTLGLDFGCFSERQRGALVAEHVLKPLPGDAEFLQVIEECARFPNVRVRASGVAGLPRLEPEDLGREERLVERLLAFECVEDVLYDRVHAQPGAPVLDALQRFGMRSPVHDFAEFLAWSREYAPNGEYAPPLLSHAGGASAATGSELDARIAEHHAALQGRIAAVLASRAPDGQRFGDFSAVRSTRFRRVPRSRVLNRYSPRTWWLDFDRPPLAPELLDEEMARVVIGHVWHREFGAVSLPAVLVDYVLAAFDAPATGADALARVAAQGASIGEPNLAQMIRSFYEFGMLELAG